MKIVRLALVPANAPVLDKQVVAAPVTDQAIEPNGAVAPTTPLTVAVYVMVSPNTGFAGALVIEIVGVAFATTSLIAEGALKDE